MNNIFKAINAGKWDEFFNYLETGGDIDLQDKQGRTALMNAVIRKETAIVHILLTKMRI